jgi:hypothetical protein
LLCIAANELGGPMNANHFRILTFTSCFLPLLAGCAGGGDDEPVGEAASASSSIYMRIGGVEGESKGRSGTLSSWTVNGDGTGKASVVTECDGQLCRVVVADAVVVSSMQAAGYGPTSVWKLFAPGTDGETWSAQIVTRVDQQEPRILLIKGVDITGLTTSDAPFNKPAWSAMASAADTVCAIPDCGDIEFPPEGWTCVPDCSLSTVKK